MSDIDSKKCGRVIRPNQKGTKKLFAKYGSKLIAVRYRYTKKHAYVTIETVIKMKPRKKKQCNFASKIES